MFEQDIKKIKTPQKRGEFALFLEIREGLVLKRRFIVLE
jgi:hypothetical protein